MKTIEKVPLELIEVEYIPNPNDMEFGKFYYSAKYNISNHFCVCGCGHQVPLPMNSKMWNIIIADDKKFSITPSIKQRFDCNTHYIITKNVANIV